MATAHVKVMDPTNEALRVHKITDLENVLTVLEIDAVDIVAMHWKSNGAGEVDYIKLYNGVSATVGTTEPTAIIPVKDDESNGVVFDDGSGNGISDCFPNGLSLACVQEAGKSGTTNPTAAVDVYIAVKDS